MLDEFIAANRDAIIARTRARVGTRAFPKASHEELQNGIPLFLDQLGDALRLARSGADLDHSEINQSAGKNGRDLLGMGLSIGQVVHDYGDVCQAITGLAIEMDAPISGKDFKTLNLCLDDAIAEAVTGYSSDRDSGIAVEGTERLGALAHEMRNRLTTAMLAFDSIRSGHVAVSGSTGEVLRRSLTALRSLIDRSLADVRLDGGIEYLAPILVAELIEEIETGDSLQAQARNIRFSVTSVDRNVVIDGDRQILEAAISNLLQNAFKFTPEGGSVTLRTSATVDRVLFEIEDECGGLAPGDVEGLFRPFEQRDKDRSGAGLGLSICLKAAHAHGGEIHVRDVPGKGCVFTLDLPRKPLAASAGKPDVS